MNNTDSNLHLGLRIALVAFVAVLVQDVVVSQISLFGVTADLTVLVVMSIGLLAGALPGAITGFCIGMFVDIVMFQTVGVSSLLFITIGYWAGRLRELRDPSHGLIPLALGAIATGFAGFGMRNPRGPSVGACRWLILANGRLSSTLTRTGANRAEIGPMVSPQKRAAFASAVRLVLARRGLDVVETEYGKALGGSLYEFRVRWTSAEIRHKVEGLSPEDVGVAPEAILLRVFFCAGGRQIILLLSGYDKARAPNNRRQQREISRARKLLTAYREAQKRGSKQC